MIIFFLPFLDFSCQNRKIASLSGYQLAFGTEMKAKSPMDGSVERKKINATPIIAIAFVLGLGAAAVIFYNHYASAIFAGVSLLLLLIAQSQITNEVLEETNGLIAVNFRIGYYLSLLLLAAGAIMALVIPKNNSPVNSTPDCDST